MNDISALEEITDCTCISKVSLNVEGAFVPPIFPELEVSVLFHP
ncbi:hypothetical protein [Clostridium saccharoperbutylacetonicum]